MRGLVIDGGGTSTEVGLAIDGVIVARTVLPSAKPTRMDLQTDELCRMVGSFLATTTIDPDVDETQSLDVVFVGMAGVWSDEERYAYQLGMRESWTMYVGLIPPQLIVMSDAELVHLVAFGAGPGLALIAGTGSIGLARLSDKQLQRTGGWGPTVDDAGGGVWLGRQACKAVARMLDGRGSSTLLIRPVAAYLRVDSEIYDDVRNALRGASLNTIARIGASVLTYAEEGDAVAQHIRLQGAKELAMLCSSFLRAEDSLNVVGYGSLLSNPAYKALIEAEMGAEISYIEDLIEAIPRHFQ